MPERWCKVFIGSGTVVKVEPKGGEVCGDLLSDGTVLVEPRTAFSISPDSATYEALQKRGTSICDGTVLVDLCNPPSNVGIDSEVTFIEVEGWSTIIPTQREVQLPNPT